ncbi:hypothetical protein M885DRAFT_497107 [Pelagophyceae sp. CCMP2097]|nr:hypothetical protein M885DRAFT_497107 [Pelagophyceae sp. CCMP2097]
MMQSTTQSAQSAPAQPEQCDSLDAPALLRLGSGDSRGPGNSGDSRGSSESRESRESTRSRSYARAEARCAAANSVEGGSAMVRRGAGCRALREAGSSVSDLSAVGSTAGSSAGGSAARSYASPAAPVRVGGRFVKVVRAAPSASSASSASALTASASSVSALTDEEKPVFKSQRRRFTVRWSTAWTMPRGAFKLLRL